MSNSTARNSFDTNHPKKVADAIKFVRKLKRERSVCAVAHFDLPHSTKNMIKNQENTITEMLDHNKICRNLIKENGGVVIKELGDAVLATFQNAPKACQSALNIIHTFKKYGEGVCTKVTITAGTIEEIKTSKEPDVYGVPVNLCNRLSKFTSKDCIIIEESKYQDILSWLDKDKRIKYGKSEVVDVTDFGKEEIREIKLEC